MDDWFVHKSLEVKQHLVKAKLEGGGQKERTGGRQR